ncbi:MULTISPECIES: class I adenylate-forming enzyme family protein [unclassified Bradyrhizobium]|uniref:class I adenylate-forming enzyme family protein n=1 Tax=unclassified Bradyrhizobium TaxID=2631580 RepID=UPI00230658B8|nr:MULTISPECIES: AMP-binding protein [unclassified Bradyrhizobium]MDA9451185.1 long-chain fatty acid--CoA ligase [Bradyrhizobium sp. CCBAU 21360]MDA9457564.1 long-chain fatty acid--CoA ligase [Bradyrhizobium sp. CCBAU 21359]
MSSPQRETSRILPARIHGAFSHYASVDPQRVALTDASGTWTYGALADSTKQIANSLRQLGIRPGDRMMIVAENSLALAGLLFAASSIDAWAIVANPRLTFRELDQIRAHSGARRVFFAMAVSNEAASHATAFGAVIGTIASVGDIGYTSLNEETVPEPVKEDGAEQVAVLIYTSGTTGIPKGVMLTHENLLVSASETARFWTIGEQDRNYLVLPISHVVGTSLLILTLLVGGSAKLVSRYEPAALAKAIAEEGVTVLNGVPATYQRLLEHKELSGKERLERGKLRITTVAGAPLDVDLKRRVETEFGIPLLNGYGITECAPGISGVRLDTSQDDHSVGTLISGVEAKLVGVGGTQVKGGEVGELHVRGRNVMKGYYRAPDATAAAIDSEGWFNTGDLARFEGDRMFIVGRTKEMIIRSGFNVYPAEVEAVLSSHPAVVQCAVVGRAIEGNEEVVAFVQALPGTSISPDDIAQFLRPQLAPYKQPSEIIFMKALPATSTGKLLKHKLKESLTS